MEQVPGIPLRLETSEPRVVRAVGRARAVVAFLFGEEVDVRAAGRELAQVAPGAPRPLDVGAVVGRLLPRAGDVEHADRVAIADGGVILRQFVQRAIDREDQDRRVRRHDPRRVLDRPREERGSKDRRYSDFQ